MPSYVRDRAKLNCLLASAKHAYGEAYKCSPSTADKAFQYSRRITENIIRKFDGIDVVDPDSADRLIAASSLVFIPPDYLESMPRPTINTASDLEIHHLLTDMDVRGKVDTEFYDFLFNTSHVAAFLRIFALARYDQLRDKDYHDLLRCPMPKEDCIDNLTTAVRDIYRGLAHDSGLRDEYHALNLFLASHQDPKMLASVQKMLKQHASEITSVYNAMQSELTYIIGKARTRGMDISLENVGDPHSSDFYGRKLKSIGSLVLKMEKYGLDAGEVNQIHDLTAFTIVVPVLADVYEIKGMVEKHFGKTAILEVEDFNERNKGTDKYKSMHIRLSPVAVARRKYGLSLDFMRQFELHIRTKAQQFAYFNGGWAHGMMKSKRLGEMPEALNIRSIGLNLFPWKSEETRAGPVNDTRIFVRVNVLDMAKKTGSSVNFFVPHDAVVADIVALAGAGIGFGLGSGFRITKNNMEMCVNDPVDFHQVFRICDNVAVTFSGETSHLAPNTIRSLLEKVKTPQANSQLSALRNAFKPGQGPRK